MTDSEISSPVRRNCKSSRVRRMRGSKTSHLNQRPKSLLFPNPTDIQKPIRGFSLSKSPYGSTELT